jgi:phage gp29-like protein
MTAIRDNKELHESKKVESLIEIMECLKQLNDEMLLDKTDNIEITFKTMPLFRIKQQGHVSQRRSAYLDMYYYAEDLEKAEKSSFFNFFW